MEFFKLVDPIITATGISKHVNNVNPNSAPLVILSQISLEIKLGESVAIIGPSGAGKTTLLGLLAGLDSPSNGSIMLGGVELTGLDEDDRAKLRAKSVGFVFQNFYLLDNLTALENVMLPLELGYEAAARARASELLAAIGLADRLNHYPRQLSGGEQQRVAIARAFVTGPAVLFADEPTGNLDQVTGEKIIAQLFALNAQYNTTLVMITHETSLAQRCDRIIHLDKGGVY